MNKYKQYVAKSKESLIYWQELSILEFTEDLARLLEQKNMKQTDLAKNIRKSAPYVSKVMNGNVNFTLKTMTKLARALDSVVHVHVAPENVRVHWIEEYTVEYKPSFVEGAEVVQLVQFTSTSDTSATYSESINFLEVNNA